jgi:hypothetical protein
MAEGQKLSTFPSSERDSQQFGCSVFFRIFIVSQSDPVTLT